MCEAEPVYCGSCKELHPDAVEEAQEHCDKYKENGFCYITVKSGNPVYTDSKCKSCSYDWAFAG
jgi:hypothetical protein